MQMRVIVNRIYGWIAMMVRFPAPALLHRYRARYSRRCSNPVRATRGRVAPGFVNHAKPGAFLATPPPLPAPA